MPELTSVASLTETMLQQKLQENRRELKRRVEALRTHLWTLLDALENGQRVTLPSRVHSIVDFAKGIDIVLDQVHLAEQMLDLMARVPSPEVEQGRITLVGCYTK